MKRLIFILVFLYSSLIFVFADDCSSAMSEAKINYNNHLYKDAKSLFEYVVSEKDCERFKQEANEWIAKCNKRINEEKEKRENIEKERKVNTQTKLSVYPNNISVGSSSGSIIVSVESNRNWKLENTSSNIFSLHRDGSKIKVVFSENTSTSPRSNYFDVVTTDGGKSIRVNFNQEGRKINSLLKVNKTSISSSANGVIESIYVESNTQWELIYPSSSTMYTVSREENKLYVKIKTNSSTEPRSDYFIIRTLDGSKEQIINLSQAGKEVTSSPVVSNISEEKKTSTNINTDKKEVKRQEDNRWSNILLINGGFSSLPDYTYGLTYARVKKAGFYFNAMTNFGFKFKSDYTFKEDTEVFGYPFTSGEKKYTRMSITAGALFRMGIPLYTYVGMGYGYRGLFYEAIDNKWFAVEGKHTVYHGITSEIGLIGNIKGFALSLGFSIITGIDGTYYPEAKVGLGYCFN